MTYRRANASPQNVERIHLTCLLNVPFLQSKIVESLEPPGIAINTLPAFLFSLLSFYQRRKRFSCNLMNTRMMIEGFVLPTTSEVKVRNVYVFLLCNLAQANQRWPSLSPEKGTSCISTAWTSRKRKPNKSSHDNIRPGIHPACGATGNNFFFFFFHHCHLESGISSSS